ncbi:MAG: site-2 protease family protein [Puniceicoccales bacterium]|jgi:Zn-dependent protease|nr:site-2 protease family protein [Puniceicoccales bacterium]
MNLHPFASAGIYFIVLLCSLALHEFAHAWVAHLRGDPLPGRQGRVTLNPFAHLDPVGSFLIPGVMIFFPLVLGAAFPVAILGWGRPVQVSLPNPKTRRMDDILITLAGPGMNLLIALVASVVMGVWEGLGVSPELYAFRFLLPVTIINVALATFNLIPIPPLDGSRVLRYLVRMSEEAYATLAANGWIILLVLINLPSFSEFMQRLLIFMIGPFLWVVEGVASLFR